MDKDAVRISFAMAVGSGVKPGTFASTISAIYNTSYQMHFDIYSGPYIHNNRNKLVDAAIDNKCTHLMFVDNDMVFPADGITKLVEHDKDVIGGYYNMKVMPVTGTVSVIKNGKIHLMGFNEIPKEVFRCHILPTGFMMIKMDVFNKIKKPYFDCPYKDGDVVGEDVYFCQLLNDAGIDIWCDPNILIRHIGDYMY